MAYPDYSIVLISVTESGVTTDIAQSFINDELARKYYDKAVLENKRAFFYEKPTPSKFTRNDSIAQIDSSIEIGKELDPVVIPSPSATEFKVKIKDGTVNITTNLSLVYENSKKELVAFNTGLVTIGYDAWEYWKSKGTLTGFVDFFWKEFKQRLYVTAGTVHLDAQVSNKQLLIIHDGSGGFTYQLTKLWPDKGDIETSSPIQVLIEIYGEPAVNIGSKVTKKTYGGNNPEDYVSEDIYTWVPNGNIILETSTRYYFSDGNGWYRSQVKSGGEDNGCPASGTEIGRTFLQDLTFPIVQSDGLINYVMIGTQYEVNEADGVCGSNVYTEENYIASGQVVYETDTTYYKSNGNGGVYEEAKDNGGGDGEGGGEDGGGDGECQSYGTPISSVISNGPEVSDSLFGNNFSYIPYYDETVTVADGFCSSIELEPTRTYIEEGTTITEFEHNGFQYIIYATTQGGWNYDFGLLLDDSSGGSGDITTYEDSEFPQTGDCPPAGYGSDPVNSTPYFKKNAGDNIVGTISPREVMVTLPNGLYVSSVMPMGGGMPSNTIKFKTGYKWSGRFLPDGNCGWVAEDESPTNFWTWRIPTGTSFPAGQYYNWNTIGTSGNWLVQEYIGLGPNNSGHQFKTVRVGFTHDGQGNVTCYRK